MGQKCKPSYMNLNLIQSYSEQKYATVQWCEQNCENDEYLKREVDELRYLVPPNVRYNFKINDFINKRGSYGYAIMGDSVGFSNETSKDYLIEFTENDDLKVDTNRTTAKIVNDTFKIVKGDNGNDTIEFSEDNVVHCRLSTESEDYTIEPESVSFGTCTTDSKGVNSFWYTAWDKSKPYYVRPDWLADWRDSEIKSVCRAQTFKSLYDGKLDSINLKLDWNGTKHSNCGSPLYIQIWKTYNRFEVKTIWDRKNKCMVDSYIEYDSLPQTSNKDDWQDKDHYQNKQKYKLVSRIQKDKKGNKIKDKKGNDVYEDVYVKVESKVKAKEGYKNKTFVKEREKIKWLGHNKKKGTDSNGKNTYYSDIFHPLAETSYSKVGEPYPTISFEKPCTLKKGESYAIVMFSPLSEWKHCPRIGGWGRNCKKDRIYDDGNAFMSVNNGRKWIRYGKDGIDTYTNSKGIEKPLEYKKGKYTPQDYAFSCNMSVRDYKEGQTVNFVEEDILQFEPIYSNPITSIGIECMGEGVEGTNTYVQWECSTDGDVWVTIPYKRRLEFTKPYPTALLVRGKLSRSKETPTKTPVINWVEITLNTLPASEMYLRTSSYKAKVNPMLGASLWGKVYAPFDFDATVNCNAEIIMENPVEEEFHIISLDKVDEDMKGLEFDDVEVNNFLYANQDNVAERSDLEKAIYLTNNVNILNVLKEYNILVKPFIDGDKLYLLSFSRSYEKSDMIITKTKSTEEAPTFFDDVDYLVGGIQLSNMVAYPMLSVQIEPIVSGENSTVESYSELLDYNIDYENNVLYFKSSTIDDLIEGNLKVQYNPAFIKGLSNNEVGAWINDETGRTEYGLLLNYFKETILIDENMVADRSVYLRSIPVNPIRAVYYYEDSDFSQTPKTLYEYTDYTYNIDKNRIEFPVSSVDNVSSILTVNDSIQVVYTPNIESDSLSIGYYATRENTDKQVKIKDGYFEYKV